MKKSKKNKKKPVLKEVFEDQPDEIIDETKEQEKIEEEYNTVDLGNIKKKKKLRRKFEMN